MVPVMMTGLKQFSVVLTLSLACISACKAGRRAITPQTTINPAGGGQIVYGAVAGAATQAAAMAKLLHSVQAQCGEKPQIGRVFQFRGTNSVGVFFSVTSHAQGTRRLAGLVIASAVGPDQVEAALLTDDAARFGKTVNPMLME